jgi:cytochrome c peroxidase
MKKATRSMRIEGLAGLAVAALSVSACEKLDSALCADPGCGWTEAQWFTLTQLADLPPAPPPDRSNKYVGVAAAELLGQKFFFDTRWSGPSTQVDVLKRPVGYARAVKGQPTNLSCASCHNLHRGGADTESVPGNVSIGAAWADTNALSVMNAAYYKIQYWNGRADSLWAQAVASNEGSNMNGNRLATMWVMSQYYRDEYNAVFPEHPLPALPPRAEVEAIVETTPGPKVGQCKVTTTCAAIPGCREVRNPETGATGCFPRYPLNGRPGSKAGCQVDDGSEPFWDAWDCMDEADKDPVTWTLVGYAKAIAAYEYKLVSRDSAFDRFVAGQKAGKPRDYAAFSPAAERGAKLFIGKAACVDCHNTPLFSDSAFYNIGVPQRGPGVPTEADCPAGSACDCQTITAEAQGNNCYPWGAADGLDKLAKNKFRRDLKWSDDPTDDSHVAYMAMKMDAKLKGAFRTPSLRDAALTAPYMHNGAFATLEDVLQHYNQGGSPNSAGARSARLKPLFLSKAEMADIIAFLNTLTGAPLPAALLSPPPAK